MLASMTGFARADGTHNGVQWVWEIRSVNGKGFDLRLRLPSGRDGLEPRLRDAARKLISRGNVSATLTVARDATVGEIRVNHEALDQIVDAIEIIRARMDVSSPSPEGLLALRGVLEVQEHSESEEEREALDAHLLAGFEAAIDRLADARQREGAALGSILAGHLDDIARLTKAAADSPARRPEVIRTRLAEQVAALLETGVSFDAQRLHQEAVMLATKVDIAEEIDRLNAHVEAARGLLRDGGAVGRRLDFLAQEFNRETNTLCSKSNAVDLTAIGLDLKTVVDRMREQVQNLE